MNKILTSGLFPLLLNVACTTPIFKAGVLNQLETIAQYKFFQFVAKLLKKIIFKDLFNSQNQNDLPHSAQFGLRENLSTSTAIFYTLLFIYDNLYNGSFVISIFLDFSKILDFIDHKILLKN